MARAAERWAAALGALSEISSQFVFFDDEKAISIRLDQSKSLKSLHKHTDPGPRRADHF